MIHHSCQSPYSISIVCSQVYPLFNDRIISAIGGMETRSALFGRGLAASGRWSVSFIVEDFGQPSVTNHEGIAFYIYQSIYRRAAGNVYPRFRKRWWFPTLNKDKRDIPLLWQIPLVVLFRAFPQLFFYFWHYRRPDIVCCFGNNPVSAEVIADCYRLGIKAILCIASDGDISPDYKPGNRMLNDYCTPSWMAHYALETADHIIVQTESQLEALRRHFSRDGTLIRNPISVSPNDPETWLDRSKREYILWVGRSDTFNKRPLLFLELAKRCPDLRFLMIVNNNDAKVFEKLEINRPKNLTIIEWVSPKVIWNYYACAKVFVSTSTYEGFPNTFLQCAITGVPVVSLEVDPANILSKHGCGLLAGGDMSVLEQSVRSLWSDPVRATELAITFHNYALNYHSLQAQINEFESCLLRVINSPEKSSYALRPRWWHNFRRFIRRPAD